MADFIVAYYRYVTFVFPFFLLYLCAFVTDIKLNISHTLEERKDKLSFGLFSVQA